MVNVIELFFGHFALFWVCEKEREKRHKFKVTIKLGVVVAWAYKIKKDSFLFFFFFLLNFIDKNEFQWLEEIYRRRGFSDSLYGKGIRIEVFKKAYT